MKLSIAKQLTAGILLSMASVFANAGLITFDFTAGPNAHEITFTDSDYTLIVAGFIDGDAATLNHGGDALSVLGGTGNRINPGDLVSFSLFDAADDAVIFDSLKLVFSVGTGVSLFSRESAIVTFDADADVEIQGTGTNDEGLESFTITDLNSSSFDLATLADVNGFRLAGIELEIASVPEPTTLAIFGLGLAGLAFRRKATKA
jgi:hypothetical protein